MGEESPSLFGPGAVRSDAPDSHVGSSPPIEPRPSRSSEPSAWRAKMTAARATISTPRFLGLTGLLLVLISAGIIVAGIALPSSPPAPLPAPAPPAPAADAAARDTEDVPLDALQAPDPANLHDCDVKLGDWDTYSTNAAAAERQFLGQEAATASPDAIVAALRSLPPLQLPIRYWVLQSPSHPWSPAFGPAAALQTAILDAAFSGMRLRFRADGVYSVPATDAEVDGCGAGDPPPESLVARLLAAADNGTAVQVVVCNPSGVNGASQVLGSALHGGALGQAIFLRRSALWQSRTSLVHQLGHYLGLGHPYPDSKTCKYDADAIVDTPRQYQAAGGGCDAAAAVPLCDNSDGKTNATSSVESSEIADELRMPIYGFMETTNDTCRRHFTPGQVLRARAMLGTLRPELAAAAAAGLQRGEQVPWAAAFQSAPPHATVLDWQLSSVSGAPPPARGAASALPEPILTAAERLTSAQEQARGAAGGAGGATSAGNCSCLGPDAAGDAEWTGRLSAPFFVDAVRLVQPWDLVTADSAGTMELLAALTSPKAAGGAKGAAATLAPAPAPAVPETERTAGPFSADVVPVVEVRVGSSPRFEDNALCGRIEFPRGRLALTLPCSASLPGPFVTVRWVQQPTLGPMCLCDVAALSQSAPPLRPAAAAESGAPGALLNATALGAVAFQSSTNTARGGGGAALALEGASPPTAGADLLGPPPPACSATEAESQPWWSMQVSKNSLWVRGVRLMTLSRCRRLAPSPSAGAGSPTQGPAAQQPKTAKDGYIARLAQQWNVTEVLCGAEDPLEINIFVSEVAPAKTISGGDGGPAGATVCAKGVRIMPGELTDVACEGWMRGRVVTVALVGSSSGGGSGGSGTNATALAGASMGQNKPGSSSTSINSSIRALELCGVTPIGGVELVAAAAVASGRQTLRPDSLLPFFSLALDGDLNTCIDASSDSALSVQNNDGSASTTSLWETGFSGAGYLITGLDVAGKPSTGSSVMDIVLLDGAGQIVWQGKASGAGGLTAVVPPTPAAAVRVSGFSTLCEVTFVAASTEDIQKPSIDDFESFTGDLDVTLPPRGAWTSTATPAANATAALDGDPRTCAGIVVDASSTDNTEASGAAATVLVTFGEGRQSVPFIQLLSNSSAANVTVSVVETATGDEVPCGDGPQGLQPWTAAGWACPDGAAGDAMALRFLPPAPGSADDVPGQVVGLCEVWGVGLTQAQGP